MLNIPFVDAAAAATKNNKMKREKRGKREILLRWIRGGVCLGLRAWPMRIHYIHQAGTDQSGKMGERSETKVEAVG